MRTLHVNTERTWRGGEQQTLLLAAGLSKRGCVAEIAAQAGSPLVARARDAGLAVHEVPMRGEYDLLAVLRLAKLLRAGGHDVVHMHTSHAHTLGVLASMLSGRARRIVSRRVDFSIHRTPLKLNRYKYRHFVDRYVAISEAVRKALVLDGVDAARISVVPSGVDCDALALRRAVARERASGALRTRLGLDGAGPIIGHVGHLTWHKGQEFLVQAMARVRQAFPRAVALIVGEGEERAALEGWIARLGLPGGSVRLVGFAPDPVPFFDLFDVFVMPSVMEGLCTSILDAFALDVPVVATTAGGIPEIVADEASGLLVPPRDPTALAAAVTRLLRDESLRERLRRGGSETVRRRFSADSMVEGTLAVYESVLNAAAARSSRAATSS